MRSSGGFESRSRARRRALQAIYQWRMTGKEPVEIISEFREEQDFSNVDLGLFEALVRGVAEQSEDLGKGLEPFVDRPLSNLDIMERVILDIGFFELGHSPGTPAKVILDECIELAKRFGAEQGHNFINGVLDKAARTLRKDEFAA